MPPKKGSRQRSKSRSRSKGKTKGKRSRSKGSAKRHTKQHKLVDAVLKQSPYNVLSVEGAEMELFGKYKPMKPMSYYQSSEYPFYPGSNAAGLLSGLVNPLKKAQTDEPYLSRLLDLNRKTMNLVEGSTVGTATDPLTIKDTRPPPFLSGSASSLATASGVGVGPQGMFVGGSALMGDYASVLGSLFPSLGTAGLSVPLNQRRQRLKTLDELTYTIDQTNENKGVIQGSNYMAVKDTDGVDPSKDFLFVKK